MKNFFNLAPVLIVLVLSACTKGYESQKTVKDLRITLAAERYPLVKNENMLTVKLASASTGNPVTNAVVNVRYYMPPMPGMAPMDFNIQAVQKDNRYSFSANIPMEGGWKFEVSAFSEGRSMATATFNLDAR